MAETHYLIEPRDRVWWIVTIMAGTTAIGEFLICRYARRERHVHLWGTPPTL